MIFWFCFWVVFAFLLGFFLGKGIGYIGAIDSISKKL